MFAEALAIDFFTDAGLFGFGGKKIKKGNARRG